MSMQAPWSWLIYLKRGDQEKQILFNMVVVGPHVRTSFETQYEDNLKKQYEILQPTCQLNAGRSNLHYVSESVNSL